MVLEAVLCEHALRRYRKIVDRESLAVSDSGAEWYMVASEGPQGEEEVSAWMDGWMHACLCVCANLASRGSDATTARSSFSMPSPARSAPVLIDDRGPETDTARPLDKVQYVQACRCPDTAGASLHRKPLKIERTITQSNTGGRQTSRCIDSVLARFRPVTLTFVQHEISQGRVQVHILWLLLTTWP